MEFEESLMNKKPWRWSHVITSSKVILVYLHVSSSTKVKNISSSSNNNNKIPLARTEHHWEQSIDNLYEWHLKEASRLFWGVRAVSGYHDVETRCTTNRCTTNRYKVTRHINWTHQNRCTAKRRTPKQKQMLSNRCMAVVCRNIPSWQRC